MIDQERISPHNTNTISSIEVMRMKKISIPSWKSPLLRQVVFKCSVQWCTQFSLKALNLSLRCSIRAVFHVVRNLGYFYWQSVAEELGFQNESRGWEGAQNPIESLLKAFGEKEGSTIRGLIEATRKAGLMHFASQLEDKFDTPRNDTTDSVHKTLVQIEANDNSTSVDTPSDPCEEDGATESVEGEINNKADSVINVPKYAGEETDANDIADTAV